MISINKKNYWVSIKFLDKILEKILYESRKKIYKIFKKISLNEIFCFIKMINLDNLYNLPYVPANKILANYINNLNIKWSCSKSKLPFIFERNPILFDNLPRVFKFSGAPPIIELILFSTKFGR